MARSVYKGPFVDKHLLEKIQKARKQFAETGHFSPIKTWSRRSTILSEFEHLTFLVHNGKKFIPVSVHDAMIGKKLGEFSPTRFFRGHAGSKKK